MIELLIVIVVISMLAALLLPAIGGAIRKSREAAVQAEMSQLGQALADFKSKNGAYPPSRILVSENGTYFLDGTTNSYATGISDISDGQLAQRSVSWLRRIWPRVAISTGTSTAPPAKPLIPGPLGFYDFNGNGVNDNWYVLTGDECLVFFLGGIPSKVVTAGSKASFGLNGFSRDPQNPFIASTVTVGAKTYSFTNRSPALYEFKADRLVDLDGDKFPSYVDSLGTGMPLAYFSAYEGGSYDPSDVDLPAETDDSGAGPLTLRFSVKFPVSGGGNVANSASPNPYTVSTTVASTVTYHSPNTFQIIGAGYDGLFGVGGQYIQDGPQPLPLDAANTLPIGSNQQLRTRESDNLTSFHNGKLE